MVVSVEFSSGLMPHTVYAVFGDLKGLFFSALTISSNDGF
jgi:hypothetical protein